MDLKATYLEARLADAQALRALAQAKENLYQTRQAAKRVAPHARTAWDATVKAAENRLAQAKRRAEAADQALRLAWGHYRATQQEAKARRATAKAAHKQYLEDLKKAA